MIYAVINTNVIVSSLITKNTKAATYQVMQHVFRGDVIPLPMKMTASFMKSPCLLMTPS